MITPIDIRKLEFDKVFRGYDPEEVRAALESIAKELEGQIKENTSLKERQKSLQEKLNHFRLIEKTLQDSVMTMQNTLEEKRKNAEQEAELIIQEARHHASGEFRQYKDQIKALREEIAELESQKSKYFIRFKSFLQSQLDWLRTMESDEMSGDSTVNFRHQKGTGGSSPTPSMHRPIRQG